MSNLHSLLFKDDAASNQEQIVKYNSNFQVNKKDRNDEPVRFSLNKYL